MLPIPRSSHATVTPTNSFQHQTYPAARRVEEPGDSRTEHRISWGHNSIILLVEEVICGDVAGCWKITVLKKLNNFTPEVLLFAAHSLLASKP